MKNDLLIDEIFSKCVTSRVQWNLIQFQIGLCFFQYNNNYIFKKKEIKNVYFKAYIKFRSG